MTSGRPRRRHRRGVRVVVIGGPDGTGKSTLVELTRDHLEASGIEVERAHWRPGRFRSLSDSGVVTDPHGRSPRSWPVGLVKLGLVVADFAVAHLGDWRRGDGVVLLERGWWDQWVDPRRYRLRPSHRRVVELLGRGVPRADQLVILAGDPDEIARRKDEIPADEVRAQIERWRAIAPRVARRSVEIDTVSQTPGESGSTMIAAIERTSSGPWRRVPLVPARYELLIEAGVDSTAAALYRPLGRAARFTDPARRWFLRRGVGSPSDPPEWDPHALDPLLGPEHHRYAVLVAAGDRRTDGTSRLIVGAATADGLDAVAKVGGDDDAGIRREHAALIDLADDELVRVPRIRHAGPLGGRSALVTDAVDVDEAAAPSLDEVVELCIALQLRPRPIVHGDLAPWNLLVDDDGRLVVVDWEEWRHETAPLFDLTHYLVQAGALLGRHTPEQVAGLLTSTDGPAARILTACGRPVTDAPELIRTSLRSQEHAGTGGEPAYRQAVLVALDGCQSLSRLP